MVRGSVDISLSSDASLLYSASHWVALIKLAEGEKKHEVVIDLFRVAIRLEAEVSASCREGTEVSERSLALSFGRFVIRICV